MIKVLNSYECGVKRVTHEFFKKDELLLVLGFGKSERLSYQGVVDLIVDEDNSVLNTGQDITLRGSTREITSVILMGWFGAFMNALSEPAPKIDITFTVVTKNNRIITMRTNERYYHEWVKNYLQSLIDEHKRLERSIRLGKVEVVDDIVQSVSKKNFSEILAEVDTYLQITPGEEEEIEIIEAKINLLGKKLEKVFNDVKMDEALKMLAKEQGELAKVEQLEEKLTKYREQMLSIKKQMNSLEKKLNPKKKSILRRRR